jgi:short-subunit dehydrogenase
VTEADAKTCPRRASRNNAGVRSAVGPADRLVHAAAIPRLGRALEQQREDFDRIWRVNFIGTVNVVRALLPAMVERGRGELVLYSSLSGWMPQRKMAAYSASKAAVNAYAEVLALECRGSGVKITLSVKAGQPQPVQVRDHS